MSAYRTPGVYRLPVAPAAAGAPAVGVPAFLGFPMRGAAQEPQPVTHWSEYLARFAGARIEAPGSCLAAAVRGFFENGGERCYVIALDGAPAAPQRALEDALEKLDALDDVDLVAVPDLGRLLLNHVTRSSIEEYLSLQQLVIDACEPHELEQHDDERPRESPLLGGRFALLDPPVDAYAAELSSQYRGTSAALYYPWLKVRDLDDGANGTVPVPPCGHVAGVYAATDRRIGVFKAPANVALQGVIDLARADQDGLDPERVNALRAFPGRGIRVFGARTIGRDHVGVRRLLVTAGRWIERNLAAVAFEPHDERLWARITRELTAYFNGLFQAGALKGASAAEAFTVKCDAETNPPASRESGKIVTEIGLAPAVSNEFIMLRISVAPGGVTMAAVSA